MENQFILILKKSDEEKLRWFQNKKFNEKTKKILRENNSNYVLGLHKGATSEKTWSKIKKDDKIYVTIQNEIFRISGNVVKKSKNLNYGKIFYPNEIDKKQINYFLFFKKLENENIAYSELVKTYSEKTIFNEKGIYKIKKEFYNKKSKKERSKQNIAKKLPFEKTIGKAKKSRRFIDSYIRNKNVKPLKALYNDKCQIVECNFTLEYVNRKKEKAFYSEVHHYNPLKNEGDDDWNNMIVLCPNHHAEFDFRIKFIDEDMNKIIYHDGKETGETIKFHKEHRFDKKNIEVNLEKYNEI